MTRTLQRQITGAMALLITSIGLLGGLGAFFIARTEPDQLLDDQLHRLALNVSDDVPPVPEALDVPLLDPDDRLIIQIWEQGGKRLVRQSEDVAIPLQPTTGFRDLAAAGEEWRTFTLVSGSRTVQVSQSAEVRMELATDSAWRAVLPMAALLPLAWVVLGSVVGRLMAPLRNLAQTLRQRPAGSFDPLPDGGLPGELVPVVAALNDLLVRQHDYVDRRRKFVADAAHQLRTPLTALNLQIANLAEAEPQQAAELVREARAGVQRVIAVTTQLLRLAQAEQSRFDGGSETADLGELTRAVLVEALPLARSRGIDLGATRLDAARVRGRPEDLHDLIANLLDNALKYGPANSTVDIALAAEGGRVEISISDRGPGIPAGEMLRVFERFYRIEGSPGEGSGLGLAIARAVAEGVGAEVTLRNREPGPGLVATVKLTAPGTTAPAA